MKDKAKKGEIQEEESFIEQFKQKYGLTQDQAIEIINLQGELAEYKASYGAKWEGETKRRKTKKHLIEVKTGKQFCDKSRCWDEYHVPLKRNGYLYITREKGKVIANWRNQRAYEVSYVRLEE